jgi:lipopolysaccharide/colanic/teichoic acid biosynthesis glycosyltransferase
MAQRFDAPVEEATPVVAQALDLAFNDDLEPLVSLDEEGSLVIDLRDDRTVVDLAEGALAVAVDVEEESVVIDLRERVDVEIRPATGRRVVETVLAVTGILVASPVLLVLAVLIVVSTPGPIWYAQVRVGRGGQLFRCYKLRTMVPNAADILEALLRDDPEARVEYERHCKLKDDPRITPLGKILRKTSLDELPQLVNVIKGDMALVGPRPVVPHELTRYGDAADLLLSVRPGLTGLWQVSGRNDLSYDERVDLDLEYVRRRSLRLDAGIILRTIQQMVVPHGNGAR